MRVAEVMTKGVSIVRAETPATDAWELMRRKGIHHLVVMNDSSVVGILSNRDAGGRSGAATRARARVGELMTPHAVTVEPDATIRKVANVMRGRTIGCLPVVKDGRLVGILTTSDLLELLGGGIDRPAQPRRHNLHYRVPHRKQKRVFGVW